MLTVPSRLRHGSLTPKLMTFLVQVLYIEQRGSRVTGVYAEMASEALYKYPDGSRYVGQWNDHGQKHGYGHVAFPDQSAYWGSFDNGLFSGLGVLQFADNSRYEGEFKQGKFNGYGVFYRGDNMKFEGEFRDGRIWGMGLVTFADGTHGLPRNEGYFEGNKLLRREKCEGAIYRSRDSAAKAKNQRG